MREFFDEDEIARVYDKEVEALLKARTGAVRIHIFDHMLRRRMPEADDRLGGFRLPATRVHVDYTENSARRRMRDLLPGEADGLLERRFAYINVWRPIHHVVRHAPLALLDARRSPPVSFRPTLSTRPDRRNLYAMFNTRHRWRLRAEMARTK